MTFATFAQVAVGLLMVAGSMAAYLAIKTHNVRHRLPGGADHDPVAEEIENEGKP